MALWNSHSTTAERSTNSLLSLNYKTAPRLLQTREPITPVLALNDLGVYPFYTMAADDDSNYSSNDENDPSFIAMQAQQRLFQVRTMMQVDDIGRC